MNILGQQCLNPAGFCCSRKRSSCSSIVTVATDQSSAVMSPSRWHYTVTHPSLCGPFAIRHLVGTPAQN